MADPWLTIIGLGEDGLDGLTGASREALSRADHVFGALRHLHLAGVAGTAWPVPFSTAPLLACRGQATVALVSGDPFWFGAGGTLMANLSPGEWTAHPGVSVFQWVAARLGWKVEEVLCRGLHAAAFEELYGDLADRAQVICTMRDGAAVGAFAEWLTAQGYGASACVVCEAVGGPRERVRNVRAETCDLNDVASPVAVAVRLAGPAVPRLPGRAEEGFVHDGQISKRHVRALTVMALGPQPGALLWDLGAGSGAVSVEWCLAAPGARAVAVEARAARVQNIQVNADRFGVARRVQVIEGDVSELPEGAPDAVFFGGGASHPAIAAVWERMPDGARLVVNAVTLETEALVVAEQARRGGTLTKIEISEAAPLGRFRGWSAARPVVQWSVQR